jgi:phage portal protein BeeE
LFARRDVSPSPVRTIGFPSDGGLVTAGVTATTTLGLSAVWRSLDILSNAVSQLEWHERRGTLDLPLSRIVTRPMADRTRREWVSLVVSTLALYDVCYLLKVGGEDSEGVPMGIWPLDPSLVQPIQIDYLSILPPDEFWVGDVRVPRDRLIILHRSPQPGIQDSLGGVLKLARIKFAEALAADGYSSRYWQAGGPMDRALETDANIPDVTATQLSDRWAERRSKGPDYWPVLSGGLKARQYGVDPTAQSAVEARRELVADIGRYFGIPTHTLNAPAGDSETYSSTEASNQDLIRYTLQNYIGAIEDAISDQLPGGRRLEMDTWRLSAGTVLAQAQAFQLATGGKAWLLPEDVRDRTGWPPVEDPEALNPTPPAPVIAGGTQ